MLPISLDPTALSLALVGRGDVAVRRLEKLRAGGADQVRVFSDAPSGPLCAVTNVIPRLPGVEELLGLHVLWIADLPEEIAAPLVERARVCKTLVNTEDIKPLCDFHNVAEVRRGDLLLTVSTGGASPGLASRLRRYLAHHFPEDWEQRLESLSVQRAKLLKDGVSFAGQMQALDETLSREGWL